MNDDKTDLFEDRPFLPGVTMTDMAGLAWKDLTPERAKFISGALRGSRRGSGMRTQLQTRMKDIKEGQGKGIPGFRNKLSAQNFRNAVYDVGAVLWGTRDHDGKLRSHLRTLVVLETDGTYTLEFVRLPIEEDK